MAAKKKKLVRNIWSSEDVKLLKRLYLRKSIRQIADQIGRSLKAVQLKASKMGLKNQRSTSSIWAEPKDRTGFLIFNRQATIAK